MEKIKTDKNWYFFSKIDKLVARVIKRQKNPNYQYQKQNRR